MIKKFLKQLDVDVHVSNLTRSLCDSLNRTSEENCSIQKSLFFQIVFHPFSVFYLHVRSKHKTLNVYTQALLLLRSPPCWKSMARHTRHVRFDSLDKVERVESCRVEPSGI